ncbi:MAG TPA: hypothetical protein VGH17_05195 [Candidatus Acidoferrales bacterium]|jgi:hypothetical protein
MDSSGFGVGGEEGEHGVGGVDLGSEAVAGPGVAAALDGVEGDGGAVFAAGVEIDMNFFCSPPTEGEKSRRGAALRNCRGDGNGLRSLETCYRELGDRTVRPAKHEERSHE